MKIEVDWSFLQGVLVISACILLGIVAALLPGLFCYHVLDIKDRNIWFIAIPFWLFIGLIKETITIK